MNHRCAIHPCREDADPGHSTCAAHRGDEARLLAEYGGFRRELAAHDQASLEAQREVAARHDKRVRELLGGDL